MRAILLFHLFQNSVHPENQVCDLLVASLHVQLLCILLFVPKNICLLDMYVLLFFSSTSGRLLHLKEYMEIYNMHTLPNNCHSSKRLNNLEDIVPVSLPILLFLKKKSIPQSQGLRGCFRVPAFNTFHCYMGVNRVSSGLDPMLNI